MAKTITITCEQRKKLKRVFSGLPECERGELILHISKVECDPPLRRQSPAKKGASRK